MKRYENQNEKMSPNQHTPSMNTPPTKPTIKDCCRPKHPTRTHGKRTTQLSVTELERRPSERTARVFNPGPPRAKKPDHTRAQLILLVILLLAVLAFTTWQNNEMAEKNYDTIEQLIRDVELLSAPPEPIKDSPKPKAGFSGVNPRFAA